MLESTDDAITGELGPGNILLCAPLRDRPIPGKCDLQPGLLVTEQLIDAPALVNRLQNLSRIAAADQHLMPVGLQARAHSL